MNINVQSIGKVHNERTEIADDFWGNVISTIEIDAEKYGEDCLLELATFSHLEVIFYMNRLDPQNVYTGSRHPRNNIDFPKVGIFAQRVKKRPNLLGLSRCTILKVEGNKITVKGLDAIDGTPIIDIKPFMIQFGPIGQVKQPEWTNDVMENYYKE